MTPEFNPMAPALEQAVVEIRDEHIDPAVVEAAAGRVWAGIAPAGHIRGCADFQSLIPDYRAGRLTEGRALLLKDHLNQCVACRHVFEGRSLDGKVVPMIAPRVAPRPGRFSMPSMRWAAAAVVLAAAGVSVWLLVDQSGGHTGRAVVQTVNGTLFVVSANGIQPLMQGQDLPGGAELRTANDSDAMLELRDGSVVEMRERSSLYTTVSGGDVTVHLGRGSVIVQAAHSRTGHLYLETADCSIAVTGTLFGVTAGLKGSRVSVVEGEVHVTEDNRQEVLHAGDQAVTGVSVEPESIRDDIGWSRNRDKLLKQLSDLRDSLGQLRLPALRYSSSLLGRLPAGTLLYVSIPNLSQYLADAQSTVGKKLASSPELQAWWAAHGNRVGALIENLRQASDYLGDEIDIVSVAGMESPVVLAEPRRDGFAEFLKKKGLPLQVESRKGLLLAGEPRAVDTVVAQIDSGFASTPLYERIAESYRQGAGLLVCADLSKMQTPFEGARYFLAEEKQTAGHMVASAALGFDGPRTGMAALLAEPSPMGSLDYVSPDATAVLGFVMKSPEAILDTVLAARQGSLAIARKSLDEEVRIAGFDVRKELSASLGGEFAVAVDGAVMPVPSWKLVAEVYDPQRLQATLQKLVEAHNSEAAKAGRQPLRTAQESFEGRTYYMIAASNPSPLLEAHYTFDQGYLIAGPTRALVAHALQVKTAGTSIKHSARFLELTPRDQHVNFSVVIYQNLGTTLAPFAALAGAFMPRGAAAHGNPLQALSDVKPTLYAVYGEPDRITMTANVDVLGSTLTNLMSGNLLGMAGLPINQMFGTRAPKIPYPSK
jgi:ferric-dicitrate binding protein FerR (iron transport regulator)